MYSCQFWLGTYTKYTQHGIVDNGGDLLALEIDGSINSITDLV
jgi:hypothetical protein